MANCKHKWEWNGKRPCKISKNGVFCVNGQECSENVYVCGICGEIDYGNEGGPAYKECEQCLHKKEEEIKKQEQIDRIAELRKLVIQSSGGIRIRKR